MLLWGFALGVLSLIIGDAPQGHFVENFRGWHPFGVFSESYHWIGFLTEAIALTLAGLGLTRHRWDSWWLLTAVTGWPLALAVRKLATGEPGPPATGYAIAVAIGCAAILLLAARLALALRRTPPRDIRRLQSGIHPGAASPSVDSAD